MKNERLSWYLNLDGIESKYTAREVRVGQAMSELLSAWYTLLSSASAALSLPFMTAGDAINIPFFSALLLGLLGSFSPCQLTTNASALALLSRELDNSRCTLRAALAYLAGKALVYTLLGSLIILAGLQLASGSTPAMALFRKFLGPMLMLLGLWLVLRKAQFGVGQGLVSWLERRIQPDSTSGAFALGIAFGLAFCPTLFALFFGLLIPLAMASRGGLLFPGVFAVGTSIPLLILIGLLLVSAKAARGFLRRMRAIDPFLRVAAAAILILAGLSDTLTYWLL
ncbi:MAG: cytochrome C biogenesis protein [Chloroflexota bacterium]|nr:MAG: cytochrome C biogenesis protein [Chloroflexota bacterium]